MRCDLQIFSGCVCHLENLHAQSPCLFPIVFSINAAFACFVWQKRAAVPNSLRCVSKESPLHAKMPEPACNASEKNCRNPCDCSHTRFTCSSGTSTTIRGAPQRSTHTHTHACTNTHTHTHTSTLVNLRLP